MRSPELSLSCAIWGAALEPHLLRHPLRGGRKLHHARLVEKTGLDNLNFLNSANGLAQHLDNQGVGNHEAQMQAYARIYQSVQAQAASLAYIDTFMMLAVGAAIMFCLAFILKKNNPRGGAVMIAE